MTRLVHPPDKDACFLTTPAIRRKKLLTAIGNGVAILPAASEVFRNGKTAYPYRFDSHFWYLSHFSESNAVIILLGVGAGKKPKSILFCKEKNAEREQWEGRVLGPAAAKKNHGFDAAYPIDQLEKKLPELMLGRQNLWMNFRENLAFDTVVFKALDTLKNQKHAVFPQHFHEVDLLLNEARLIKDAGEIALMQQAARITDKAHEAAMRGCCPGMMEYQLEAEISFCFRHSGADAHAYAPIVAGGTNALTLHYTANNQVLKNGELVLIDAGCEIKGYAADISRTFPVNGRFSAAQKHVYDIVLAAQTAAIAAMVPGAACNLPHVAAVRLLTEGLCDLKLLKGDVDGLIEKGAYRDFYMHNTSHWLGLDVHDVGSYKIDGNFRPLEPGMVLTVEPGLYIGNSPKIPKALQGIGIRIEDDVLITSDAPSLLTHAVKSTAAIEDLMAKNAGALHMPPSL